MCGCVCVCVCMCACMRICMRVCVCIGVCACVFAHMNTRSVYVSVTLSPVITMVLMLALCKVCITGWWGEGGDRQREGGRRGVCDPLTCDHDGPDVGSVQGVYHRGGLRLQLVLHHQQAQEVQVTLHLVSESINQLAG